MARLTAGSGSGVSVYDVDPMVPSGTQGYQYGTPYENYLDKQEFNRSMGFYPSRGSWPNRGASRPPGVRWGGFPMDVQELLGGPPVTPLNETPSPFALPGPDPAWSKSGAAPSSANDYGYDMASAGFQLTVNCGEPGPAGYVRKIGFNPPSAFCPTFCANGDHTANAPLGDPVPAGTVWFQLVAQHDSLPWPDESGVSYKVWHWPTGSPGSISEVRQTQQRTLPTGWSAPEPGQGVEKSWGESPSASVSKGGLLALQLEFGGGYPKGPTKTVHYPVPPPKGTKEKKFQLGKGGLVGDTFGVITEILDFADCLAKAAGATHHMSMQKTSDFIAENFDMSDPHMIAESLKCVALSNLEDMAIGMANSRAGKAFGQASGAPRGVGIKRPPSPYSKPARKPAKPAAQRYGVSHRMR